MDYTKFPLGTVMEGGTIKVCPQCERPGLAIYDAPVKKTYFTHGQTAEFVEGELRAGFDYHVVDDKTDRDDLDMQAASV